MATRCVAYLCFYAHHFGNLEDVFINVVPTCTVLLKKTVKKTGDGIKDTNARIMTVARLSGMLQDNIHWKTWIICGGKTDREKVLMQYCFMPHFST